jgi:hypothetical protein
MKNAAESVRGALGLCHRPEWGSMAGHRHSIDFAGISVPKWLRTTQPGPFSTPPLRGWTYQEVLAANLLPSHSFTLPHGEQKTEYRAVADASELRWQLACGLITATGTTSVHSPPQPIPRCLWEDLELVPRKVHDTLECHARAPSGEIYFQLKFYARIQSLPRGSSECRSTEANPIYRN